MSKIRNIVAKHARKFNKSIVMTDRKKLTKQGYVKHKEKLCQHPS